MLFIKKFFFHFRSFNVTLVKSEVNNDLFDGALEFVHVALEEREVGEEEVLEAAVLLRVGRQHEDDPDGDLLLAGHAEARPAALIRHVEALLHGPGADGAADRKSESSTTTFTGFY